MFFQTVSVSKFRQALTNAESMNKHVKANVESYSVDQLLGFHLVLTTDGLSGFAVKPDGELTAVFSSIKGRGESLVAEAIKRGAVHLNAFDGYLTKLYSYCGFTEYKREPNWDKNGPDVVFMTIASK